MLSLWHMFCWIWKCWAKPFCPNLLPQMDVNRLMREKGELNAELARVWKKVWEANGESYELRIERDALRAQLDRKEELNAGLRSKVARLKEKKYNALEDLQRAKEEKEEAEKQRFLHEDNLNQARARIASLESHILNLESQSEHYHTKWQAAQDNADVLEGQLNDAQAALEQLLAAQQPGFDPEPQPLAIEEDLPDDGASGIESEALPAEEDMDMLSDDDSRAP